MHNPYALFVILFILLALLIWGRWRYDIVAFFALLVAVLVGVVPVREAFTGFSNAAVITVACVMVITRAITQSGIVDVMIKKITPATSNTILHILVLGVVTAVLSAFMNNIGALALMMPVAIQSAINNKRSPSIVLMPLAFSSVLGGLMTVIGTPPNILISSYRLEVLGSPFAMFDFFPVGVVVTIVGVLYVSIVGWRLIPEARRKLERSTEHFHVEDYITEVRVPKKAKIVGKSVREFEHLVEGDFVILGLVRNKRKRLIVPQSELLKENDVLIVEASHKDLEKLLSAAKLELVGEKPVSSEALRSDDIRVVEVVVPPGSRLEGRSSSSMRLRSRFRINLLAIARQGKPFRERLQETKLHAGDVVLLQGDAKTIMEDIAKLGFLPLIERGVQIKKTRAFIPIGIFVVAIVLVAFRLLPVQIAFSMVVLALVLLNVMPIRRVYETIDWSIIILLGAIIPIGSALQATGGTDLLANGILALTGQYSPMIILALLLMLTMTLSDVMNNAATAVVMAPIAVSIANALHANIDPFLMTVAVGASCSFLTPIGHQNNTLVMGPGGYKFFDYFRVGLPLEVLVLLVGLPMILYVWPL